MPFSLSWTSRGAYAELVGHVTPSERARLLRTITEDARFDGISYVIVDFLGVSGYELDSEMTSEIAAMHIGPLLTNPRLRLCAVTTRSDVRAGLEMLYQSGLLDRPYRIVSSLTEAIAWVDE